MQKVGDQQCRRSVLVRVGFGSRAGARYRDAIVRPAGDQDEIDAEYGTAYSVDPRSTDDEGGEESFSVSGSSTYEQLGLRRDRMIGMHRWVVTRHVDAPDRG